MSKVYIPFNKWSRDRLRSGVKIATSRIKQFGRPRDIFLVDGRKYIIVSVEKISLGLIAAEHYKEEGADSPQEFIDVWIELHPKKRFYPNQIVHFHRFKLLEEAQVQATLERYEYFHPTLT